MPGDPLTSYSFDRGADLFSLGARVDVHVTFDVGDELIIGAQLGFGPDGEAN
jgi:hypothetical protein